MLINRVSDVNDRGENNTDSLDDHNQEYQTASELFDIMSKDHNLDVAGNGNALTPGELVLLYKKLDVGANLVSESSIMPKRSNQYVETIVYEDDPDSEDSDGEIYNTDDVNVYDCNKERLDILNNRPSCGNSLCQKLGGIEIQSSKLKDYHQHFNIFQGPFIKDQLNYDLGFDNCDGAVLPATLLDYICCKRLEDNYNFYMDNIIRYVKHTIEQLKRISNGDFLTDKAKEKWREVTDPINQTNSTKILATSTSIPLHIERKTSKHVSAWDDIIHSEVDVRSLSKILEKKIIVEVPKLICGTYKLFSRRCADNLIISCKREKDPIEEEKEGSRVDVVLQLEKSHSGHVVSNISSIMILKTQPEICRNDPLALPYKDIEESFFDAKQNSSSNKFQIVEIKANEEDCYPSVPKITQNDTYVFKDKYLNDEDSQYETHNDTNEYPYSVNENVFSKNHSLLESSESNEAFKDIANELDPASGSSFDAISTDDLQLPTQILNMPSSLPEESIDEASQNTLNKKKSPTRIRIKSPYENQSYILEEKKRRRLLEIREKRERKKLALGESCKISKHKYARGGILPQASSSVTKLSITNKSFYNSIYGQTVPVEQSKVKNRKGSKNDVILEVPLDHEGEHDAPLFTPDTKKYVNRSYYLDDTETEIMYMEMKKNENNEMKACSASTSVESSDFRANLTLLSQLIGPSVTNLNDTLTDAISEEKTSSPNETSIVETKDKHEPRAIVNAKSIINLAPANTPKRESTADVNDPKKTSSTVECRKSIDRIYDLMKKLEKGDGDECDIPKSKSTSIPADRIDAVGRRVSSTIQGSDSGTSLKHHLTSSNPSCFSFEKTNIEVLKQNTPHKKPEIPVVPKVIISNKVQIIKLDGEKHKKPKRSIMSPTLKTQDNPLKAISKLLHEFDNVQKCRQKTGDSKPIKKQEVISNDVKSSSYQGSSKRRSRLELHLKETEALDRPKVTSPRKLKTSLGFIRNARQPIIAEDNHDMSKRKINDIIDEAKEARGEAVKGPSKLNSRLNSLAQPKKSYVQARIDEHQFRPTKVPPERQQKLSMAPLLSERNVSSANAKNKLKRIGTEAVSSVCVKQPSVQPLDKTGRKRRSANSSPEDTSKHTSPVPSSKRNNVPPTPETLKKIVAAESYVKTNYRRVPPMSPLRDRLLVPGHKSRIPLLPKDIELASVTSANTAEESTEVGSKLHHMISTMLDVTPGLTVLSEDSGLCCKKTNQSILEDMCKGDERASVDSDYPVDVFEDKNIVTAVERIPYRLTGNKIKEGNSEVLQSTTEIQKLENALCRKWPLGAFQKRLRIKNFTLTPKHSMKQVFVLQSGDVGSLVIKSSLSKTDNLDADNEMHDLKALPVLSKSEYDWSFTNFPMQIATVGYAFPHCQTPFDLNTKIKPLRDVDKTMEPVKIVQNSPKDLKDIDRETKPLFDEMGEDEAVTDDSSIPALKIKLEKGKIDLINSTLNKKPKTCENTSEICVKAIDRNDVPTQKTDMKNVNYTTSLDMLVGLLNEIQKITSCQTHMTNNATDDQQCKELESILDDAAALEASSNNPKELISIASLDKLRKLESHASMYTIYLSSDEENDTESKNILNITADVSQPLYVDKEINVDIDAVECINRFTDVPSIYPLNVSRSTNVTNSLIGVLSQPSSQSVFSYMEYQTLYSNASFKTYGKIVQLPQRVTDETKHAQTHTVGSCKDKEKLNDNVVVNTCQLALSCKETPKKRNQRLIRCKKVRQLDSHVPDFDPMLKMKRDILVTVYSILVLTVFAALSFPEVVYHV